MEQFTYSKVCKNSDSQISRRSCILLTIFTFLALCMFIAGVVLLAKQAGRDAYVRQRKYNTNIIDLDDFCEPSEEARRIRLNSFLEKCQKLYFKLHPSAEYYRTDNKKELDKIARRFTPYMPTHEFLKRYTDEMLALKREMNGFNADQRKLKPKESQILAEIKVFLDQFMGEVYDIDFYGGDWMFGPNYFCLNMICRLPRGIQMFMTHFKMKTEKDIVKVIEIFLAYKKTFQQYTENMKLGVKTGMVKSKSSCKAGADAMKERNNWIYTSLDGGARKMIPHDFTTAQLPFYIQLEWRLKHNETVRRSLERAWINGFAKPLKSFVNYLENVHIQFCPPDSIASGLASLPLSYIYYNGTHTNKTTKRLPITNTLLSGTELYKKILPRFTTTDISPEKIFEEGVKQLEIFYSKLINATKAYTKEKYKRRAIKKMKEIMKSKRQWHGVSRFPKNESDERAYKICTNDEQAKKYCPVRWNSIQKWGNYMYRILGMIPSKLNQVFHFTGSKVSVPSCPIKMTPHYNPSNGAMFFRTSDAECTKPCEFGLPFFLERYGPKFQEWSVNGHEGRPGHHFQYQGMIETFPYPCSKGLSSFFHSLSYLTGFAEGWALYGENPILSHDVNLYEDNPLQEIGMYKWQIWRAIRLVVDTGLHYRHKNREWALKMFEKYAWDKTDFPRKEVTRYMSCPGQATAYMIGRLKILEARRNAETQLGKDFDLKDFHYQVLSLGQAPLGYLLDHINRYISCKKNPAQFYCNYMLTPVHTIRDGRVNNERTRPNLNHLLPRHEHYI